MNSSDPLMARKKMFLPEDWQEVELEEIVECFPGAWGQDQPFENSIAVQVVGTSHISNEGMLNHSEAPTRYLSQKEYTAIAHEGDLLVVKSSGSASNIRSGKTAICPKDLSDKIACSNFLMHLVPRNDKVEPYLLWLFLNSDDAKAFVRRIAGSSTYPNIKWSTFKKLRMTLPPLFEQKRIAKILNEQMAAVEKPRKAVCHYFNTTNILSSAYLRNIFSQDNLKRWPKKRFGDIAQITAKQVNPTLPEYRDLPHVNGENIESGTGRLTYLNTAAEERMISGKYLFPKGSVLYSKLRPYLRKVALVDFDGVCSADMYPIQVDSNYLRPDFAAWLLLSDEFTNYAVSKSQRARMPKLNRKQLFSWEAPLPTLDEQKAMINKLMFQIEKTMTLTEKIEEQAKAIDALPSALLRKAFRGEI